MCDGIVSNTHTTSGIALPDPVVGFQLSLNNNEGVTIFSSRRRHTRSLCDWSSDVCSSDLVTAWQFLRSQGIPAARIAIGGDSAGGGLTVALITRLRDAREDVPACTWLVSPWTDLTMSGSTLATKDAVDPLIHKGYLEELADAYLDAGMDRKDPRVSPLYADLRSFPPILIQVGSAEVLLEDATRFSAAAGAADVPVTLEIWPHMIHAWHLWNAHLEPGRRALASAGAFIRANLSDSSRGSVTTRPGAGES